MSLVKEHNRLELWDSGQIESCFRGCAGAHAAFSSQRAGLVGVDQYVKEKRGTGFRFLVFAN